MKRKNNKTYKNIFVEEKINLNVDTDDDLPLSTWKLSRIEPAQKIIVKKLKDTLKNLKREKLMLIEME